MKFHKVWYFWRCGGHFGYFLTFFKDFWLKFTFSDKPTKIAQSYSWFFRLLRYCQNHDIDCAILCGLLRKAELYFWCKATRFSWNCFREILEHCALLLIATNATKTSIFFYSFFFLSLHPFNPNRFMCKYAKKSIFHESISIQTGKRLVLRNDA